MRHAIPDLVHLPVHRPPLRLLHAHPRGGAEARRWRLGPTGAASHEAPPAVRPPPLRVQAAQHRVAASPRAAGQALAADGSLARVLSGATGSGGEAQLAAGMWTGGRGKLVEWAVGGGVAGRRRRKAGGVGSVPALSFWRPGAQTKSGALYICVGLV
jgi:hypothetical protein